MPIKVWRGELRNSWRNERSHNFSFILNHLEGQSCLLSYRLTAGCSHSSLSSGRQLHRAMPAIAWRLSLLGDKDGKTVHCQRIFDSELRVWAGSLILVSERISVRKQRDCTAALLQPCYILLCHYWTRVWIWKHTHSSDCVLMNRTIAVCILEIPEKGPLLATLEYCQAPLQFPSL